MPSRTSLLFLEEMRDRPTPGLSIRRRLTCPGEGGDLLDQLLPFGVRPVVVVLTAGSFADLRLTASRALSGRASRQQGDLIDDILHLIGERIRFFTGLRTAVKLLLLLLLLLLSGLETRTMLERLGVATPIAYGGVSARRDAGFAKRASVAHLHEA